LAFFPEEGPLADYCNGDRLKRIHAALPPGSVALTCTLFFDEINRDQKRFNTGDGGIVVGGFFRSHVRESTDAKVSFCTFPKATFGHKNRGLTRVGVFLKKIAAPPTGGHLWLFHAILPPRRGRGASTGKNTIHVHFKCKLKCQFKCTFKCTIWLRKKKIIFKM
jgi:hypothetical protein